MSWKEYLEEYTERSGRAPGYRTETMGCQMNERDSETIAGLLADMGYRAAESRADAAVIVVNTCSVRENADQRFFGILGQLKKVREVRPDTVIAVCGCMMQQQHIVETIQGKYPWVDIIFGTHTIHLFPDLLRSVVLEKIQQIALRKDSEYIVEGLPARRTFPFKAYVNIMYGCNNFCTYCIVPYTRGRERSRDPREILAETRELVRSGVKEITLLGQNVNSYDGRERICDETGAAVEQKVTFPDLIYRLDRIRGLERIRFMTSHPKDLSDQLIQAYRDCRSLCPAIHLPVQSGSSRILASMNRHYTKEVYLKLIEKLRTARPDIVITTDLIVGFPGETEADFAETMDLIETVRFDSAFTFLYSVRRGTPAENYADQVPEEIKHRRFNRLVERLNVISAEKNSVYLNRVEVVLAEGPSRTNRQVMTGRTAGGKLVNFMASEESVGKMVAVRITGVRTFSLYGEERGM